MAETYREADDQFTNHIRDGTFERTAGVVLAAGALVMLVGGVLHPPSASAVGVISANTTWWLASHWLFAAGSFTVVLASLLVLTARSEVAASPWTVAGWGAAVLGGLLATVFLIGEATVLPDLAASGAAETFATWRAFIETGVLASLLPVSLGFLVVAGSQARHPDARTPRWAASLGVVTFAVGLAWIVGFGFLGIESFAPLFIVELVGFVWLAWLGVNLARSGGAERDIGASTAAASE